MTTLVLTLILALAMAFVFEEFGCWLSAGPKVLLRISDSAYATSESQSVLSGQHSANTLESGGTGVGNGKPAQVHLHKNAAIDPVKMEPIGGRKRPELLRRPALHSFNPLTLRALIRVNERFLT